MDTTEQNRAIALVPEDDGAINNAINDLDAKIAAWVEAMRDASTAIAQVARAETSAPKRPDEAKAVDPQATVAQETAGSPISKTVVALPAGKKKDTAASGTKADSEKPASGFGAKLRKLVGGAEEGAVEEDPNVETQAEPKRPAKAEPVQKSRQELEDEDEALLAQLDPKLAKSIRIKRRLSRGKKSVRELIDEGNK